MADWKAILRKFTGRKWLTAISVEVGLLVALITTVTQMSGVQELPELLSKLGLCVGEIIGLVVVAYGYIKAEASIDKEAVIYGDNRNEKKTK